ncbi:hypothetical protein Sru01_47220 [Sphaerisporangium rufum]|uniref:Sulfotransferase family protein n=1 Tax=Sphaerisporangium rufum TaxID=1381558 RepID=A0A919V6V8_9ACTN|nr:hypothetical protein [Sphaerisporangium rufum]GII79740.1 hypothetical protein Sru01_47220 [Sphaerisporangium rufum]
MKSPAAPLRAGSLADHLRRRYSPVLVILSPPRCGSTVVARSCWRHPLFRWYVHEPCDRLYHRGDDAGSVRAALSEALDAPDRPAGGTGHGVVIKEMTFQARPLLAELAGAATLPVVVTVRDPRLAIRSRMRQLEKAGEDPCFPPVESGWADLGHALALMRRAGVPYVVTDVTRLSERPADHLPALCARLGIPYTPAMLSWPRVPEMSLGRLDGEQRHWYARVLSSTGFQPPDEQVPPLDAFPAGMRAHVAGCLAAYEEIMAGPHTLEVA